MRQAHILSKEDFIIEEVLRRLADHEEKVNDEGAMLSEATYKTQIPPWLERTKWLKFMSAPQFSDLLLLARSARTTFESHAQRTAEKQGRLEKDKNPIFEDSVPNGVSYVRKSILLDSLLSTLYSYLAYTSY
jgi:hypothetical protein